jgi:hypothetical protein
MTTDPQLFGKPTFPHPVYIYGHFPSNMREAEALKVLDQKPCIPKTMCIPSIG